MNIRNYRRKILRTLLKKYKLEKYIADISSSEYSATVILSIKKISLFHLLRKLNAMTKFTTLLSASCSVGNNEYGIKYYNNFQFRERRYYIWNKDKDIRAYFFDFNQFYSYVKRIEVNNENIKVYLVVS